MQYWQLPRSDTTLQSTLEQIVITGQQDRAAGRPLVSEGVLNDMAAFLADWSPKLQIIWARKAERAREVSEANAAARCLALFVRDAWEVQKRRIVREDLPRALLELYGLPLKGRIPQNVRARDWPLWAERLIHGDEVAVAQGYAPLVNPSAAEIAEKLALANQEAPESDAADRVLDEAQAAAAAGRRIARDFIQEAMDQIRFNLRRESPESVRRVMRSYGATFRSRRKAKAQAEQSS